MLLSGSISSHKSVSNHPAAATDGLQQLHVGWMVFLLLGVGVAGMAIGLTAEAAKNSCIADLKSQVLSLFSAKESLAIICSQTSLISNSSFLIDSPRVFLFRYGNATSMAKVTAKEFTTEDPRSRSFYSQMIALPLFETKMLALSPDSTVPGAVALRMFCTNGLQYYGANVDVKDTLQQSCHGYRIGYDVQCFSPAQKPVWSQAFDAVTMCVRKA